MIIQGEGQIDFSIIPWLICDLKCPHCMYNASPRQDQQYLSRRELFAYLKTINWNDINSIGFYGGEVFLDLKEFSKYLDLVQRAQLEKDIKKHKLKPMWCITNGTFSNSQSKTSNIVTFSHIWNLKVYISTTPYHKKYQHHRIKHLPALSDNFSFKKDDTKSRLLPMGRNATEDWYCTRRCQRVEATERLAIKPNGDIIYQKCDGVYPVLASINGNHVNWITTKYYLNNYLKCPMLLPDADIGEPTWVKHAEKMYRLTSESSLPARSGEPVTSQEQLLEANL